ncbi:MAG: sugar phosphate isomerase/epimerase [Planctomycetes bacterium]|nr:sugar phosphate isomerase/epimerase [Planctomycetota bacterium]
MLALDTDSIAVDSHPGMECFSAGADCGFRRFLLGTARDAIRGAEIIPALRKARLRVAAVAGPRSHPGEDRGEPVAARLAAPERAVRERAQVLLAEAAVLASRLGGAALTLELGRLPLIDAAPGVDEDARRAASRDQALDRVLPRIFDCLGRFPEVVLAVEIAGTRQAWPQPGDLEIVLSELAHPRLGWWFDTARAWRLERTAGVPSAVWFERHRDRLRGATLCDAADSGEDGLPLGSGAVDFGLYREHRSAGLVEVVRIGARFSPGALQESRRFLEGLGIV